MSFYNYNSLEECYFYTAPRKNRDELVWRIKNFKNLIACPHNHFGQVGLFWLQSNVILRFHLVGVPFEDIFHFLNSKERRIQESNCFSQEFLLTRKKRLIWKKLLIELTKAWLSFFHSYGNKDLFCFWVGHLSKFLDLKQKKLLDVSNANTSDQKSPLENKIRFSTLLFLSLRQTKMTEV